MSRWTSQNVFEYFEPDPDDDFINKREEAIKILRTGLVKKRTVDSIMGLASGVCEVFRDSPSLPDALATQIESAIKKQSPSFMRDDRDLEMGVCAAVAVVQTVNSGRTMGDGWYVSDVLAVALWSALSFLPACNAPKLEEFRRLAVDAARDHILKTSLQKRHRREVPDFGPLGGVGVTPQTFVAATTPTIDALRLNAALDREEIDLLWWVLGSASNIFRQPLQSLSPATRAVVTGVEMGALMRALPTQSHRNLALRGIEEADPLSLPDLLTALGEERLVIAASFNEESLIGHAPLVFPLLAAISSGEGIGLGADLPRSLAEWAARALLERAVFRIQYDTSRTL